ncbi:LysR family transcriptional regulator [Azoarcus olearius]|uniref:LysR family transcriptional regulator n=1 Tax=Azoarcus sp. (strain BH72) TaxID=418699 RepID=UPI0008061202|nr:LysR family transcriptional regulator [Azoarcus olearius]ANQ85117.1 LysR family transcriptional regulator [Azoarcus olearius]
MRRKIPSTAALQAFDAAARHESFTRAADELALTQSAICRQIAGLEDFLGVALFRRTRRGVRLTEAGLNYSRKVAARLDAVERDTLAVMAQRDSGATLEIATVPTFATRWLLPRLPGFLAQHPDVTINLSTRTRPFLFDETEFDAAIYFGDAGWPGTEAHFLMREYPVPVCSPLLPGAKPSMSPAEIAQLPLLQQTTRPYAWRHWFESLGMSISQDMSGPRLELFSMLAEAAIQRLGVALIPPFLIRHELDAGLLITPTPHAQRSERAYYFIVPERKSQHAALGAFRAWLVEETARYAENENSSAYSGKDDVNPA